MARKPAEHTPRAPKLPPAPVDFNALHEACAAGKPAGEALNDALIVLPRDLAEDEMLEDASGEIPGLAAEPFDAPGAE